MMPLDATVMWAGTLLTVYLWGQILSLSGWMLVNYTAISSKRERIDTACCFAIAALFIFLQLAWSVRGLVSCQGIGMEIGGDIFAYGAGFYIHRSLMGRHSFYVFCHHENRRATDGDASISAEG